MRKKEAEKVWNKIFLRVVFEYRLKGSQEKYIEPAKERFAKLAKELGDFFEWVESTKTIRIWSREDVH